MSSYGKKGGKKGSGKGGKNQNQKPAPPQYHAEEWEEEPAAPPPRKGNKNKGEGKSQSKGERRPQYPRGERLNGPYLGLIGKRNTESDKGFAFIESPVCRRWYGQDVYVFPRVMDENNLEEGDAVAFCVHENDNGKPAVDAFKPIWKLMMPPKDGEVPPLGEYEGTILNITDRGHAYIQCPEVKSMYRKDVYVNAKVVEANGVTEAGAYVSFNLHINQSGMPQASSPMWVQTNKDKENGPPRRPREDGEENPKKKARNE